MSNASRCAALLSVALGLIAPLSHAGNSIFISDNVITGNMWNAATNAGDGTSGSCGLTRNEVNFYNAAFFTDVTADTYSLSLQYPDYQSGFVYLYEDSFDPDDPCAGIFEFGLAPVANIYNIHLDANRQYFFVTSEDRPFIGGGAFQVTISGPAGSNLVLGSPSSASVTVSATPVSPPVVIPASGGSFSFKVTLVNTTSQSQTFDLWTAISGPTSKEPANRPRSWTVGAGATLNLTLKQRVAGSFPAGTYTLTTKIGTFSSNTIASDSFTFEKAAN
jgi:hypothetical protein